MIPRSNVCWNSFFATGNRSGARRLALAAMGDVMFERLILVVLGLGELWFFFQ